MNPQTDSPRMEVSVTQELVIDEVSTGPTPTSLPRNASVRGIVAHAPDHPPVTRPTAESRAGTIDPPAPVRAAIGPGVAAASAEGAREDEAAVRLAPAAHEPPAAADDSDDPAQGVGSASLAAASQRCPVGVASDPALREPTTTALTALNAVALHVEFVIDASGTISVSHGGEWPVTQPPLGWTAPDRRTILINPDHPASQIDAALADVIVHELGHVLISADHVDDGSILDPQIDGHIMIGQADRHHLETLTCSDLGL